MALDAVLSTVQEVTLEDLHEIRRTPPARDPKRAS
jgi:hypothetical protein